MERSPLITPDGVTTGSWLLLDHSGPRLGVLIEPGELRTGPGDGSVRNLAEGDTL
jgi:hypothetical protein